MNHSRALTHSNVAHAAMTSLKKIQLRLLKFSRNQSSAARIVTIMLLTVIVTSVLLCMLQIDIKQALDTRSPLFTAVVNDAQPTGGVLPMFANIMSNDVPDMFNSANDVSDFFNAKEKTPLAKSPLYWVLTAPQHDKRTSEILQTWGKDVGDHLHFYGASRNYTHTNGATFVNVMPESEFAEGTLDSIVEREMVAWQHIYEQHGNDYEWFVKADDDTFYVLDNLESYLATMNPNEPWLLGFKMHRIIEFEHVFGLEFPRVHGGAGYILSIGALRKLYAHTPQCRSIFRNLHGDTVVAGCLATAGVIAEDTRLSSGKYRFNMDNTKRHSRPITARHWRCTATWGEPRDGDCCDGNSTLSYHYMIGKMKSFSKDVIAPK